MRARRTPGEKRKAQPLPAGRGRDGQVGGRRGGPGGPGCAFHSRVPLPPVEDLRWNLCLLPPGTPRSLRREGGRELRSTPLRVTQGPPWPARLLASRAVGCVPPRWSHKWQRGAARMWKWVEGVLPAPGGRTFPVHVLDSQLKTFMPRSKLPERLDCLDSFQER